jgi:hypothetical protein
MSPRLAGIFIAAACTLASGCALPLQPAASTSNVGDSCLVGTWTLVEETNQHGYSLSETPVAVSGLAGSKLTITSRGDEKEVFDGSHPLEGTLADGRTLAIKIGGSFDFHIHGDGHKYAETGQKVQLPTSATVDGQPVQYHSSYSPGSGTYQCSSSSLTITTSDGNQTDTWSKG